MLKTLYLNKKKIPIPVPLLTLQGALEWVEAYLVAGDKAITKVELNGRAIEYVPKEPMALDETSKLFIQIDSPVELSSQTLDAVRNLISMMHRDLKNHAVLCWGLSPRQSPAFLDDLVPDLELILNLLDHVALLLNNLCPTETLIVMTGDLTQVNATIQLARSQSDWRGLARILLKILEPKLADLNAELGQLQKLSFELSDIAATQTSSMPAS
jgi:hypothetical protein